MESTSSRIPRSSSSSSIYPCKYEVFLSFHGRDTRNSFTDHLRYALEKNGITVFKDDTEMERGEHMEKELFEAIKKSRLSVVVISENYASSKWCLKELIKIVECRKHTCMQVYPVFYKVEPSKVRHPKESFTTEFGEHRSRGVDEGLLNSAATALEQVGYITGWHVHNRPESGVIEEISKMILKKLKHDLPEDSKFLVGMESPMIEMQRLLEIGLGDVRFIGICGMSGIGKTTLARVVYESLSSQFDGSCFVSSIGEASGEEVVRLQKLLLSEIFTDAVASTVNDRDVVDGIRVLRSRLKNKRVFIVLDDVCQEEQITALAGGTGWFGSGSRIIITSTTRRLPHLRDDNIYALERLSHHNAKKLFYYNADVKFHLGRWRDKVCHESEFVGLKKSIDGIVECASGHPLALKVFGSFLGNINNLNQLKSYIDKSKANLHKKVLMKLKIPFDGLDASAQEMFKDVACFFNGWYENHVISELEGLDYFSESTLLELECNCLITFSRDRQLLMHSLLEQMGREIAKGSRFWHVEDIISVSGEKTEIDKVKGVVLKPHLTKEKEQICFDAFSKMKNLRMLLINLNDEGGHCKLWRYRDDYKNDSLRFKLNNKLRLMKWTGCPLTSLSVGRSSKFMDLVKLSLKYSLIERLWNGDKVFQRLKQVDLSFSKKLIEIPNLSQVPQLEILNLSFCECLESIDSSIGSLEKLTKLLLRGCGKLEKLPNEFISYVLEVLDVSECSKLKHFPDISRSSHCLKNLNISRTAIITELPGGIQGASNLQQLSLNGCSLFKELSKSLFSKLRLFKLNLSNCDLSDGSITELIHSWNSVSTLDLSKNKFKKLPDEICELSKLEKLILDGCTSLQTLPKLPLSLHYLHLRDCPLLETLDRSRTSTFSRDIRWTSFCFCTVAYVGFDGQVDRHSHKLLELHPQSPPYTDDQEHLVEPRVVCVPTRGSEIPDEFIPGRFSSKKEARFQMHWELDNDGLWACALLIVYKDTRENKKRKLGECLSSNFGDNDRIFPEFVCQLQLNQTSPEQNPEPACEVQPNEERPVSSIIRVPELACPGIQYRVWVLIIVPDSIREPKHKKRNISDSSQESEAMKKWSYLASVTACSENVELGDCRAGLLLKGHPSSFLPFARYNSQRTLVEQSLSRALDALHVTGPIRVVSEADRLNQCCGIHCGSSYSSLT